MTSFCVTRIDAGPMQPRHGILAGTDLALIDDARQAAAVITGAAEDVAAAVLQRLQEQTLRQAHALLSALERRHAALLDGLEASSIALARGLFAQLAAELPPAERFAAAVAQLQRATPQSLSDALLFVHPDACAAVPAGPWQVRADPALAAGACRLEAGEGEWHADFDGAVAALLAALTPAAS